MSTPACYRPDARLDSESPSSFAPGELRLRCPLCGHAGPMVDPVAEPDDPVCSSCGFAFERSDGIWNAVVPKRLTHFRQFMCDYQLVRASEGRGSSGAHFYLALPDRDLTGRNTWQWKIRARTYRYLERKVLPGIETLRSGRLDVLDIGAGNCWMSYRLALRGHRPVAVDLLTNGQDGLGAARHYFNYLSAPFPRFQAEMDRLPFDNAQFDLVVFNASFHYSEDYSRTLAEAIRCLRPSGQLLILDSPFYHQEESGERMVEERREEYRRKYGFASNSICSREFLTPMVLDLLARNHCVSWRILKPWYGIGWALRPLKARLTKRREPAQFYVLWGRVETP
jgi:SAM-dependent methyltransferase